MPDGPDSTKAQIYDVTLTTAFVQYLSPLSNVRRVVLSNPAANLDAISFCTSLTGGIIILPPGFFHVIQFQGDGDGYTLGEKIGYVKGTNGEIVQIMLTR